MSSFVRRIERQIVQSRATFKNKVSGAIEHYPPRLKFYMGRGSRLGVKNPRDKALIARRIREAKRSAQG
jgi:hypothetical protein